MRVGARETPASVKVMIAEKLVIRYIESMGWCELNCHESCVNQFLVEMRVVEAKRWG